MNVNWLQIWAISTVGLRIAILFLFVLAVHLIIFVGKGWWILGFSSVRTRKSLGEIASAARTQNLAKLRLLAPGFREHTLEGGLRQISQIDSPKNFNEILAGANKQFQDMHGRLDLSLANLSRWRNLALCILAAGLSAEVADIMLEFVRPSIFKFMDIVDGRPMVPFIASIGLWIVAALLVIQWHFANRLRARTDRWNRFVTEMGTVIPFQTDNR